MSLKALIRLCWAEAPTRWSAGLGVDRPIAQGAGLLPRRQAMAAQTCSEHCPGLWGSPPTTQLRGGGASIPPLSLLIPEAHSTLRFPRSRVAVRCLRTSVSWGLGPRGLAPCRRGCSFRYCSSFDSPRRSSAMSSAKNKGRSYTGRGMVSVLETPPPPRTPEPPRPGSTTQQGPYGTS